jgi:hypothetical protein
MTTQQMGALNYAFEQLHGAVRDLAISHDTLLERLKTAWGYRVTYVRDQDLADPKLGERIATLKEKFSNLHDFNAEQQSELADEVVSIYTEVVEQHQRIRSSPR